MLTLLFNGWRGGKKYDEEIEQRLIEETLRRCKGDKKKTAEVLGIGLRTLYRRLEKLEEEGAADQEEDPREQRDGNER